MTVGMILQPFLEERFVNGNVISRFREQKVGNTGYHMAVRRYEISFEEKISPSKRPCNVLFTIAGFHTVRTLKTVEQSLLLNDSLTLNNNENLQL